MMQLLVLLIILCPIDIPIPSRMPQAYWTALKAVAKTLEVTGPGEIWLPSAKYETAYVKDHFWEIRDFPPLADMARLPPPWVGEQMRDVGWACRKFLDAQCCSWHQDEVRHLYTEANQLLRIWGCIREAQRNTSYVAKRRSLNELRELLGPSDYYAGNWPPTVPLHRFQTMP